jgi:DNA invertase Pin-like site-specific DNA recombinase
VHFAWGVAVVSYTEPMLSTENEMVRSILLAVMASMAKCEAERISERTKTGLARARRSGVQLRRPSALHDFAGLRHRIVKALKAGQEVNETARMHGVGNCEPDQSHALTP